MKQLKPVNTITDQNFFYPSALFEKVLYITKAIVRIFDAT